MAPQIPLLFSPHYLDCNLKVFDMIIGHVDHYLAITVNPYNLPYRIGYKPHLAIFILYAGQIHPTSSIWFYLINHSYLHVFWPDYLIICT